MSCVCVYSHCRKVSERIIFFGNMLPFHKLLNSFLSLSPLLSKATRKVYMGPSLLGGFIPKVTCCSRMSVHAFVRPPFSIFIPFYLLSVL